MDSSIFMDKEQVPSGNDLRQALGEKYELWMEIREQVFHKYPEGRGIGIPVTDRSMLKDIFLLLDFKLAY